MHHIKYSLVGSNLPPYIQIKETNNKINGRIQIDSTASPSWITNEGNLGVYTEQDTVNLSLQANIGDSGGTSIKYGLLPPIGVENSFLPLGLTMNSDTGAISGTVVETKTDPVNIINFTDDEKPLWNDTSYYIGNFNEFNDVDFTDASAVPRKGTTIRYFLNSGYLPLGLSLNSETCVITGNTGQVITDFTIPQSPEPKPRWVTLTGKIGDFGEFEDVSLFVTATPMKGTELTYFIIDGSLPIGLTLNVSTGEISGNTRENMNPNDIVIFGTDVFSPIFTTNTDLGTFAHNDSVNITLNATPQSNRNISAYTIHTRDVDSDGLPVGLTLDRASGAITGAISTINPVGTYPVTVRVFDNTGRWTTKNFTITINSGE